MKVVIRGEDWRNRGVCEENMCYLCAIYAFIENAENTGREIREIRFLCKFLSLLLSVNGFIKESLPLFFPFLLKIEEEQLMDGFRKMKDFLFEQNEALRV